MKLLSVTIAVFKREWLLKKVLDSLCRQTLGKNYYEVILCDSNSSNMITDMVKFFKKEHPDFDLKIKHTENVLAKKRNLGIKESKNEVVIFMDDDCIPEDNYLQKYFDYYNFNPQRKDFVCGVVRFPSLWVNNSSYYMFRDNEGFHEYQVDDMFLDYRTIVVMNMAFLKESVVESDLYVNENFLGYGMEDQDFGFRIQGAGHDIGKIDAVIYHFELSKTIHGYGKKVFHTARDGMTYLMAENFECFNSMSHLKLIDSYYQSFNLNLIRKLLLNEITFRVISRICDVMERCGPLRFDFIYRYMLAHYYYRGSLKRADVKAHASDTWYV